MIDWNPLKIPLWHEKLRNNGHVLVCDLWPYEAQKVKGQYT